MKRRVGGSAIGLVLVMALAVGACGSEATDATVEKSASDGRVTTTSTAAPGGLEGSPQTTVGTPKSSSGSTTTAVSSPTGSTQIPATSGDKPRPKLHMTAEVQESCVAPGGKQTITISTEPEAAVGYDAVYSDGKGGAMEGHYGGNLGGRVDDQGTFTDTWVVAPNAPVGQVKVNVLGGKLGYEHGEAYAYFSVADLTGKCG